MRSENVLENTDAIAQPEQCQDRPFGVQPLVKQQNISLLTLCATGTKGGRESEGEREGRRKEGRRERCFEGEICV